MKKLLLLACMASVGCKAGLTKEETKLMYQHCQKAQHEHEQVYSKGSYYKDKKDLAVSIAERHKQIVKLLEAVIND